MYLIEFALSEDPNLFLKNGPYQPLSPLFSSLSFSLFDNVNKIADDWICTTDLSYRKHPLYQLRHNLRWT